MYDSDVDIMLAISGQGISRDSLRVHISGTFNRKVLPEPFEVEIDKCWTRRSTENRKLWNGSKFRLASAEQDGLSAIFHLGLTGYKDFLGTNWSPKAHELRNLGCDKYKNSQSFMSDALGVGSLVETSDKYFILIRRSSHCGEAVGLLDIPGGHPEPQEIVGKLSVEDIDISTLSPEKVVDEIYDSTLREIVDEVNIPRKTLTDPLLIGIARNTTSSGRPSSEYYVKCSLSRREIESLYQEGSHVEAEESTGIHFVSMDIINHIQEQSIWTELAPSAKGCIILFNMWKQARKEGILERN